MGILADEFLEAATSLVHAYPDPERSADTDARYRQCDFCDRGNERGPNDYGQINHQPECLLMKVIAALGEK